MLREALVDGLLLYVKFSGKSKYNGEYRSAGKTYFSLENLEGFVDCSKHAYADPQQRKRCLGYKLNTRIVLKYSENEAQLSSYCQSGYVFNKKAGEKEFVAKAAQNRIDELKDLLEEVGSDSGSETGAMIVELAELEEDQPNKLYGARKNPTFNPITNAEVSRLTIPFILPYPITQMEGGDSLFFLWGYSN